MRESLSLTAEMKMLWSPELVAKQMDWSGHYVLNRFWLILSRIYMYMTQGKFAIAQGQVVQSFKAIE